MGTTVLINPHSGFERSGHLAMPNLSLGTLHPGTPFQAAAGPRFWTGDPGGEAPITDLATTIPCLTGCQIPGVMEGRVHRRLTWGELPAETAALGRGQVPGS